MNVLIKKVNMREKCSVWVTCLILVIFPIILTGCPPLVQCDQKITNPDLYINRVQSNPVIRQITKDMNIRRVDVASCVVNRQVSVSVLLEIPSTYSEYSLQYIDYLNLTYLEDKEALRINSSDGNTIDLEKNAVLEPIKRKIEEVENDPRVQEVIQKTKQDPLNPTNTLFHPAEIFRLDNRVVYSFYYKSVREYLLSNDIDWQTFPEIHRAHEIIETNLLIGNLAGCTIGKGQIHSYTTTSTFHDSDADPWRLTIALICKDGWKDASVWINPDGTYDRLEISTNY